MKSIKTVLILAIIFSIFFSFVIKEPAYSLSIPPYQQLQINPRSIAINPLTDQAAVTDFWNKRVSVIDLHTQNVLSTISLSRMPLGVSIDHELNLALVSYPLNNSVSVISLDSFQVLKTISVGMLPVGISIDLVSHRALVSNFLSNSVSVIDLTTLARVGTISVGMGPVDVAIDLELRLALVANGLVNKVSVIDLESYRVIRTVSVGMVPVSVGINSETHVAGVVNLLSHSLTMIDLVSFETRSIGVGGFPVDVAINSLDNRALILCDLEKKVVLVDLDTNAIINEYEFNKRFTGVAVNPYMNMGALVDNGTGELTLIQLPNPIPEITVINPETVLRGSQTRKVMIEGAGFIRTSTVSTLPVTLIDNHHLEVELPDSLLSRAGTYEMVVTNSVPDGGSSNVVDLQINNPVPSLIALNPAEAIAGTPGLTFTVLGTGFFNDTIVSANGVLMGFTLIDPTMSKIQLAPEDLEMGKNLDIRAYNPPPGGGQSNPLRFMVLNPVPSLLSINPSSIIAGSPNFTLTLTGNNFVNTSVVRFNNQQYPVTFINKNQIQTTIPSNAITTPGSYPVKVINPAPGGGESSLLLFDILNPVPSLLSINPTSIIAGSPDFTLILNGDNFITTSIVNFDNQQYPIRFNSKTQIEAMITSSAIVKIASYLVKVINPSPGGGGSLPLTFTVTSSHPNVEPQPEGSFGKQYQDLIPSDATVQFYDPKRFSIITGLVRDHSGFTVSDVSINILDRLGYGTAKTDTLGRFSIPVEGGGTFTVIYQKAGLLTAHRKVYVPWNDIAISETIVMIPEDTKSTTLTFDGNVNTVLTHESTLLTDDRGSRSSTLVFTGDNRAYSVDASGDVIQELTTITTRVTEFTTEDSMPAKLPPNSAYTYCVELSVDGTQRVRFDKPVILWIDNFLGFNVGEVVPVGYYDRDRGVWVPSDNGLVVRLLDTNGDGIVDAMDANNDGQPDDLNSNGSISDEVMGLSIPQKYIPGSTFWRVTLTHFTPFDCNWPYGPPADATPPNPQGVPDADQQKNKEKDCRRTGSVIEERSRIFHEDISIPGTDMTLHYASNRVKGFQQKITVPASGPTVPASLKSIAARLEVAGRTFEQILNPLPNQKAEFIWDGLDHLGRSVSVSITAHVSIGFVYNAVYWTPRNFSLGFAQSGSRPTDILARQEVIQWKRSDLALIPNGKNITYEKSIIAEGWTISLHHFLSFTDLSTLHKGDGTIVKRNLLIIDTIAGNGMSGYSGDEGPATEAKIRKPNGLALDSAGNLYIADVWNNCVRKVDTKGIITTVAGNGQSGYSGDGGPATQAKLYYPYGLAIDNDGNLYIADSNNNRIRKVDTNGIITTSAGTGITIYNGDGIPANQANLYRPYGLTVDKENNIYIAETYNHRIRKVDTGGIITTVAGNGIGGYSGDGGGAIESQIDTPYEVTVDSSGNLYIADSYNDCIRKVDPSGIITTVAGNGMQGYMGDGGPATQASLFVPVGIGVDAAGNLYISDTNNYRIRKVDQDGIITTVAGGGVPESEWPRYAGDGSSPTEAVLDRPEAMVVDPPGNLYISDTGNRRIRKVAPPSTFSYVIALRGVAFAEENGMGYILDSSGRHKSTIDLDTGCTLYTFGYNQNNNLVSITDQFGNTSTIQRNVSGTPTAVISPDGLTTTLTIDVNNNLTRITYPDMSFYGFEYNPGSLMTVKIEPEGNRFEHMFDSSGKLTDVTDQEGGTWQYSRSVNTNGDILTRVLSAEGNLTSYLDHTDSTGAYISHITDPSGAETVYTRSADQLTATKSLPCGMNITFKYGVDSQYKYDFVKEMGEKTTSGLEINTLREKTYQDTNSDTIPDIITEKVTFNGKPTTFVTNTIQSKKTLTSSVGRTTTSFYDPNNILTTKIAIPGLYDINFGYDTRGRLTSINTDIRQTTLSYDAQGNLSSITDPENKTITYSYDAVGRITSIIRPDSSSISFTYDKNGNVTVLTNPSTINHGFGYNKINLNSFYQTPLSGSYGYLYDKDRQLKQINFPSGKQIDFLYDHERLSNIQTPEGNIILSYLCGPKVSSLTKEGESTSYEYDGSLITSETLSGTLNQTMIYAYNSDFNVKQLTFTGGSVNYTYDNDGLLIGAGAFTITRNAGNGLPEEVTGGSLNITRAFNGYGELESQNFVVNDLSLFSWNLTRDKAGRIISKTETIEGTTSNYAYTYDFMGRLLTVTKDGALIEEYQYDSVGRRTYEINLPKGISGRTFTYSDEDHLITTGDVTYQYNLDGFLTTKTQGSEVIRYSYTSLGELLSVNLLDGRVIEYINDPLGRRIAKIVDGVTVEKYLWQGLTRLLAVYDGSNNLVMRFEYSDVRMPVAVTRGGATYYLTYDQVGSLRVVSDASGNVIKSIDYDSFGSIISDTNPAFTVPFGFAGGMYDADTGLARFGLRDYDPDTGRWTAKDPIGFWGGDVDLYGYVTNNPIKFIDPRGLWRAPGHRDLTTGLMTDSNAFTAADIARAVQSNLNVDRLSNQFNDPAHYMPGTQAAAETLISNLLERAVQSELAGMHNEAMDALGEGLHTVQDRYSHFEQNAGWVAHMKGAACDDPGQHPREFTRAQDASRRYVEQFLRRTGRR